METIEPERTLEAMLLQGGTFLHLRRIVGAVALLAGALALIMHGPGLLM